MIKKQFNSLLKLLGFAATILLLNACSSEPSPWTKAESPWDQRRTSDAEAPAADSYKADLEMAGETDAPVELSYQTESVESFAPEASAVEEPMDEGTAMDVDEAPMGGSSIMDQPANYYTVQLMASVDIDRVYRFAEQNNLSSQYVVPTLRDGVTWHVLLLGVYPDYSSAVTGRDEVAPLLTTQPWIRSVGSIQKLMQ